MKEMSDKLDANQVARLIERDQKAMETQDPSALAKFQRELWTVNTLADGNPGFARDVYSKLDERTQQKCHVDKFDDGREYLIFPDAFPTNGTTGIERLWDSSADASNESVSSGTVTIQLESGKDNSPPNTPSSDANEGTAWDIRKRSSQNRFR